MNSVSNWLRFISTPWPRAITGSSKRLAAAGFSSARAPNRPRAATISRPNDFPPRGIFFRRSGPGVKLVFARWAEVCIPGSLKFYHPHIADVKVLLNLGQHRGRWHAVQIQHRQRLAAGIVTAQTHAGDVYLVLAHQGPDVTHDTGAVLVVHEEQNSFGDDLHRLAHQANDAGLVPLAQDRAAGREALSARFDRGMDPLVIVGFLVGFDFLDDQAEAAGERADVDLVHIITARGFEKSFQEVPADRVGGQFGGFAAVGDDDLVVSFRSDLGEQPAEFFRQRQERFHDGVGLGVEVGEVHRIADRAVQKVVRDRLGDLDPDVLLRLLGAGAQVGRHDDLRQTAQRKVFGRRFGFVNVERGAGHLAALDRFVKVGLVDEAAAGAVDYPHARFHLREGGGTDQTFGFIAHWQVHGDEISARVNLFQVFDQLHLQGLGARQRQIRIVRQHAHAESRGPAGHFAADSAYPKNAEGFVVKLDPLKRLAVPLPGFHRGMGLRNVAGQRHQHGTGQLGGGDGVAAGRVHDHHAVLRGRFDIDVIDPDAGAAHDFQMRSGLDYLARDLRFGADDQGVGVGDQRQEFRFGLSFFQNSQVQSGLLLEILNSLGGNWVADQHVHTTELGV